MTRRSMIVYRPSSAWNEYEESWSPARARSRSSAVCCGTRTDSTCCPSKATSIRIRSRSGSVISDELCQNSAGRIRVHEPDLEAEQPAPRRLVDQLGACGARARQLRPDVLRLERHVVHPGAALREEPADRRVVAERRQQLDPGAADAERRRLHALVLEALAVLDRRPEQPRVALDRLVEVGDRDADVVDAGERHQASSSERTNRTPPSRHAAVHEAVRASSSPREASSTNATRRPRASSPRIAASSQTSVATPKRTTSSGSSSARSRSAFGFVKTSKCFFRSRNSRPRSQRSGTFVSPSGTGSSCAVSSILSAPRVPRRQCGG